MAASSGAGRPAQAMLQGRAGQAPFTKGGFLQGLVFPVLSRFSMPRARARARPGQASLAGLGRPGLAPFTKGGFLQGLSFPVLNRFSMPRARARAARPAWLGWAGTALGCADIVYYGISFSCTWRILDIRGWGRWLPSQRAVCQSEPG